MRLAFLGSLESSFARRTLEADRLRGEIGNEVVDRFLKTVKEGEKYFGY